MDSRNLSTHSMVIAEEASSSSDDHALAKDASLYFQFRRYTECLDVLNKLRKKAEENLKILHNISIVEYIREGSSNLRKLLDALNSIKKKNEELACASAQWLDPISSEGNKAVSVSKVNEMMQQYSTSNSLALVNIDEFDPTVATMNVAIVLFHLHEYSQALSVLQPLFLNIEPIDEVMALRVCFLLLDVALACQNLSICADVLIYLERTFGVGYESQTDSGSCAHRQSSNSTGKSTSVLNSSLVKDASDSDSAPSGDALENSLSRTLSFSEETLEYETMFNIGMEGQNFTKQTSLSNLMDPSRAAGATACSARSISTVDLKLKMQLYKVQFLICTRNLKQAKREIKLAVNIARGRDSSMALVLKSELEYARGNYPKAIKLLMASSCRAETGSSSMFNNLGCIYFLLGMYHTSSIFFTRALKSSSSGGFHDKWMLILYNCGLQCLACGKASTAAQCFRKTSLVFHNRSILWLRLAECCLTALHQSDAMASSRSSSCSSSKAVPEISEIKVHVIGKGKWRHIAMENGMGSLDSEELSGLGRNGHQPKLSMSLAHQCLLNAKYLLLDSPMVPSISLSADDGPMKPNHKNSNPSTLHVFGLASASASASALASASNVCRDGKDQKGGALQEMMNNSISCHEDSQRRDDQKKKEAIVTMLAYVELEMGNPERALSHARSLLELPKCSRRCAFLCRVYAAEALCLLNKPEEAADYLSVYLSGENKIEMPFTNNDDDCEPEQREKPHECQERGSTSIGFGSRKTVPDTPCSPLCFPKPETARGMLYANFAAMHAMQGDLERACIFATEALSHVPDCAEATVTAVYIDIILGKPVDAVSKLKQCSRVRFLPTSGPMVE